MPKSRRRGRGEGAVFHSASKDCWIGRVIIGTKPNGKPRYKEVSARTKGEALAKMRRAEDDVRAGRPADVNTLTLGQYLDHWLTNVSQPSVETTTWMSYERVVRLHLKPRVGGHKLTALRPFHVEQLFAELQRDGVSGGHARKISEVLSTALEHAVRMDLLRSSPAASVPKPKPKGEEIVPFTVKEVAAIRHAAEGLRLEAIFALAIGTGARIGELLGLGWDHVHFEQGTIHIQRTLTEVKEGFVLKKRPKSERGNRVIDLPRFALDALREHRKAMLAEGQDVKTGSVFVTRTGGHLSKSSFTRQVYEVLLARAKVPYRKFHTFRHTHVSELLHRGESVVEVARRIGDRPDVILRTYAKYLPGHGERIATRLDEMYGKGKRQGGVRVESGG